MKKLSLIALFIFSSTFLMAQELRLNTYAGYIFKDQVDSYYSSSSYFNGTIQDGLRWGLGLEYHIPDRGAIEIQYLRQDTSAPTTYLDEGIFNQIQNTTFDLGINYIFINGTRYFPVSEQVEPFAGAGMGLGIFGVDNPDNGNSNSATKFSWQVRGGSNFWLAENIALRVQASLVSATQAIGGGLYFGTGGVGGGLSSYSSLLQFGLEGGIVFRIPQK
ncbi:outer membrane beta-barrel protein [Algoriphagus zhangzhouensis]|uniref:Opacity protein n=1 Tax=Algoriphagus zhangzhouensis TaxID=1073327 RepID=A0A1M7ZHL8_9BACT|nr:outer membrane beta-barrel protein [Algoriphagus zhangzhouensis]TDY44196.1 opacity protein-like surface antigen [Algoriphagus zhangzhouensis]SHO64367.1 Opacity protein [Algoriphagus zhangzhouensis]